jgi:hypothetical protein
MHRPSGDHSNCNEGAAPRRPYGEYHLGMRLG